MVRALWVFGVLAALAVLNRLASRHRPGPSRPAVVVRVCDAAPTLEGKLRALYASGRFSRVYVQDLGSGDESPLILERLSRKLHLTVLPAGADPPAGACVLDLDRT